MPAPCCRLQELLLRSEAVQLLDLTNCSALRHLALPALQPGNHARRGLRRHCRRCALVLAPLRRFWSM